MQDIGAWDTSSVTDMSSMFERCPEFDAALGAWDTSSVTTMTYMFYECRAFEGAGITSWDTSSVRCMECTFLGCHRFNEDLRGWNVSRVTDRYGEFANCPAMRESHKPRFPPRLPK